jgi:hypothetical protein
MNVFLLDLWHDLREKRLWPVALALVVALVAVPVMLMKPVGAPSVAPPPADTQANQSLKEQAKVVLANDGENGSKLNLFKPSDPFKPPKGAYKKPGDTGDGGVGPQSSGASAAAGAGGNIQGGSAAGSGASAGGGTTPAGSGTTSPGGFSPAGGNTVTKKKVTKYTYVIDVTYTHNGHTRKEKGMTALEMLPNSSSPLLVFLGVNTKATDAVFIVDQSLKPTDDSEGTCKPSSSNCNFVSLGAGNQEKFTTDDGQSYTLTIDNIRRVKVKAKSAKASSHKSRKSAKAKESFASTGDKSSKPKARKSRTFVPPMLLNLVTVSNSGAGN